MFFLFLIFSTSISIEDIAIAIFLRPNNVEFNILNYLPFCIEFPEIHFFCWSIDQNYMNKLIKKRNITIRNKILIHTINQTVDFLQGSVFDFEDKEPISRLLNFDAIFDFYKQNKNKKIFLLFTEFTVFSYSRLMKLLNSIDLNKPSITGSGFLASKMIQPFYLKKPQIFFPIRNGIIMTAPLFQILSKNYTTCRQKYESFLREDEILSLCVDNVFKTTSIFHPSSLIHPNFGTSYKSEAIFKIPISESSLTAYQSFNSEWVDSNGKTKISDFTELLGANIHFDMDSENSLSFIFGYKLSIIHEYESRPLTPIQPVFDKKKSQIIGYTQKFQFGISAFYKCSLNNSQDDLFYIGMKNLNDNFQDDFPEYTFMFSIPCPIPRDIHEPFPNSTIYYSHFDLPNISQAS